MIKLVDIHKSYNAKTEAPVLSGLNLTIQDGEFVAILGRSGSGKTTLLNLIGGLDHRYSGIVEVEGQNLKKLKDTELSRFRNRTIAFVFQTFNLLPHLSCFENVAFPASFDRRLKKKETVARAKSAMERVGILHKAASYPMKLSGGERQRVAIARAIFQSPRILLADEPTGNLDSKSCKQVMDLFMDLNKQDKVTLILVTHDESLAQLADRIVRIVDGVIVSEGVTP